MPSGDGYRFVAGDGAIVPTTYRRPHPWPKATVPATTRRLRLKTLAAAGALSFIGAACGTSSNPAVSAPATTATSGVSSTGAVPQSRKVTTTSAAGTTPSAARPCGVTRNLPAYQHVVWIVMENRSYGEIVGSRSAPYLNSLSTSCGLATNYSGVAHPSLPNYIALTSGSTQGVTDDSGPRSNPVRAPSLFSLLGSNWRALEEGMPSNCAAASSSSYAVKHNPAAYYTNIPAQCNAQDVPLGSAPDISARFTFITPNLCHDMHDCSTSIGDAWLAGIVPQILNSPQYRAGTTAVFITWDENDAGGQRVPTYVIGPSVVPGTRSAVAYNHYSLLRSTEDLLGLRPLLAAAATAQGMRSGFGL